MWTQKLSVCLEVFLLLVAAAVAVGDKSRKLQKMQETNSSSAYEGGNSSQPIAEPEEVEIPVGTTPPLGEENAVQIDLGLPGEPAKVTVEFWTSPQYDWNADTPGKGNGPNVVMYDLLREMLVGFDDDNAILFAPQMYIINGTNLCSSQAQAEVCDASCTNGHRYCGAPQHNAESPAITGKAIVEESLRRMCMWSIYGGNDNGQDDVLYFDYLTAIKEKNCDSDGFQEACFGEVFASLNFDANEINSCMQNAGGLEADSDNALLQDLIDTQTKNGVDKFDSLPALLVNGEKLDLQGLSIDSLFEDICQYFLADNKPDVCQGDVEENIGGEETAPGQEGNSLKVTIDLWTTPQYDWDATTGDVDGSNKELYDYLREIMIGFDDDGAIIFKPYMFVSTGEELCSPAQIDCGESCTNGQRYCIQTQPDPVHSLSGNILVKESLRRMCIWEIYGHNEDTEDDVFFFDYITTLGEKRCDASGFHDSCVDYVLSTIGIDKDLLAGCMERDGGLGNAAENPILQKIIIARQQQDVNSLEHPLVFVDGAKMELEGLTLDTLFASICGKFPEGENPDICQGDVEENIGEEEAALGDSPNKEVIVEVWTAINYDFDPTTGESTGPNKELQDHLREVMIGFDGDDALIFRPHMYVANGGEFCSSVESDACNSSCTNGNRYCSQPLQDPAHSLSGNVLVKESLRRMCIWEIYGHNEDMEDDVFYFDYIDSLYEKRCDSTSFEDSCLDDVFSSVGIDKNLVEGCMLRDGGLQTDVENPLLQALVDAQQQQGISNLGNLPLIFINGVRTAATGLSLDYLFESICSNYVEPKPDICQGNLEENLGEDEDPYGEEGPVDPLSETTPPVDSAPDTANYEPSEPPQQIPSEDVSAGDSWSTSNFDGENNSAQPSGTTLPPDSEQMPPDSEQMPPHDEITTGDLNTPTTASNSVSDFTSKVINVLTKVTEPLSKCEVDTIALIRKIMKLGEDEYNIRQEMADIEQDIPMLMSQTCPEEQEDEILQHLKDFHMCSLFNLQELIETGPSILTGLLLRCGNAYSNMTKEEEEKGYIPEQCIRSIEADSLLGRGIFGLALYPDKVCPCFDKLQESFPECTADVFPIPINGALIKVESCLVGQYCQSVDGICADKLQILDECLPPTGTKPKDMVCEDVFQRCTGFYDILPPMLSAIPAPDACVRVAGGSQFYGKHVIERYDVFRRQCGKNIELWEGHSRFAELKAFVTDGVKGVDVSSLTFIGGALVGFFASIIFVGIIVLVKKVLRLCRRCWARCCRCCRNKNPRPKKSSYSTLQTEVDEFTDEPSYRD